MTPLRLAPSGRRRIAVYAPRSLNAPIGWRLSSFRYAFSGSTKRSGVRTATPASPAAASRTSWAVTTLLFLLLRRRLLGLGGRTGSVFVVRVAVAVLRLVFLHDPGHVHEQIARGQVHHLHALGVATRDADALDRHADHDALLGDHHQLVVREHLLEGDDVAGLVRTLQRDDAPSAAVLHAVLVELGALAHPLFGDDEQRRLASHHHHVDHVVFLVELDPLHAGRRASHVPHVFLVEADAHPVPRGQHDVVAAVGDLHVDQLVALLDVDGADPHRARIAELRQDGLLHDALLGGEQQELILGELPHRHEGGQALVRLHGDARDDRLAARRACRLRDLMNLEPVALPLLREEHDVIVRRGDDEVLEPVVFFGVGGDDALAAASLPTVRGDREPLDVAGVGHGDDHVLFGDQVLDRELALVGDDLGAALVAEAVRQLRQLLLEDLEAPRLGAEDLLALLDELAEFLELILELGDLEGGEPGEPHVEDLGRLLLRQLEALAQGRVGRGHVLRLTNDLHHLVDVVDGDLQAFENVLAVLRPLQLELGAPRDDRVTVLDEVLEQLLQSHLLRRAVDQGQHDRAERGLHLGVLVQLVQHHRGDRIALQIDDDPHALAVGVVLDVRDAVELLVVGELGDLRDQVRLVHLIGNLGDDDLLLAARFLLLDHGTRPQHDPSPALLVALLDAVATVHDRAGGEVGALDGLAEILDGRIRVVHQVIDRLDRLGEVVRRDVRGHPDRDARRPVHDQVRQPGGEHRGLLQPVVEVGDEVDGALVDVVEHRHRDAGEAGFGVGGRGRRGARPPAQSGPPRPPRGG